MAPLPDVTPTILDGALGTAIPSSARAQLKIGCAPRGIINTVQGIGDTSALIAAFGKGGDLVEASALALQQGGPIYVVNANPSTYGAPGTVTKTSSGGASTLAVAAKPFAPIRVKCSTGGTIGNAQVQTSLDGGATYSAAQVSAATVMLNAAPFVTIAMSAGTYVVGDTWDLATDGTPTFAGSGNNGVTVSTASCVDGYSILVTCIAGGALGTATFTYSLDNGNVTSGQILVPASGKYVIPDTGLLLTFTGTLVAAEAWSCTATAASYSGSDMTSAFNAAVADPRTWGTVHIVGPASTVAAAATLAATLDSLLTTAGISFRYARGLIEVPVDTDANTLSAFAAASTLRVGWCAGTAYCVSPLNGRQQVASSAWPVAARLVANAVAVSEDLGYVSRGPLPAVSLLAANTALPKLRDESSTVGLDAGRFITLRSIIGRQGLYITNGRLGAPNGSDYTYMQYGRVIDVVAAAARNALLTFLNANVRVNTDGTIYEKDAGAMEAFVTSALRAAVVQTGDATAVTAVASRTQNVLSSSSLPWSVRVQPLGVAKFIPVDVGFIQVTTK